jgi:sortase A
VGTVVLTAALIFARTLVLAIFYYPDDAALNATSSSPATTSTATSVFTPTPPTAENAPVRFIIPSLSINAGIQYVGVNAIGNMRAPSNFTDVAWYKNGPPPGDVGSAVIDGHVDNGLGLPGVFKNLGDLHPGNDVYIMTRSGATLHFIVTDVELYPYQEVPAALIFNQGDVPHLNLITCDGAWIAGEKTYDHRLVVFTKLAS